MNYFVMLAMGIVVEGVVLFFGLHKSILETGMYSLLINGITHPVAWWSVEFQHVDLWLVECCVVAVEAVLVLFAFRVMMRRALLWSAIANTTSAIAGLIVSRVL